MIKLEPGAGSVRNVLAQAIRQELLPLLEEAETSLGLGLKDAIGQLKVKLG